MKNPIRMPTYKTSQNMIPPQEHGPASGKGFDALSAGFKVNENRVPWPGLLLTSILPPWASIISFTIARPNPVVLNLP